MPSRRQSSAMLISPRKPSSTGWNVFSPMSTEVPTAKWSELRYGLFGQLEDHDGEAAQA